MTLYLIAHKVRGEPAFDIAIQMEMPDGPWWIIPTSGHRAYPFWTMELFYLCIGPMNVDELCPASTMPADLPDHYPEPSRSERPLAPPRSGRPQISPPTPEDL